MARPILPHARVLSCFPLYRGGASSLLPPQFFIQIYRAQVPVFGALGEYFAVQPHTILTPRQSCSRYTPSSLIFGPLRQHLPAAL